MAHFHQTVTWVGLELNAVGVTGKGWATRESGITRRGGVTRGGGVTRIRWTLDAVSTEEWSYTESRWMKLAVIKSPFISWRISSNTKCTVDCLCMHVYTMAYLSASKCVSSSTTRQWYLQIWSYWQCTVQWGSTPHLWRPPVRLTGANWNGVMYGMVSWGKLQCMHYTHKADTILIAASALQG